MTLPNLFASGSSSPGGAGMEAIQGALMNRWLMKQFGLEETEKPIMRSAQLLGVTESGYPGVVGLQLFGATMTHPQVRLICGTAGKLICSPEEFVQVGRWFQQQAKEYAEPFQLAEKSSEQLEILKMLRVGGK